MKWHTIGNSGSRVGPQVENKKTPNQRAIVRLQCNIMGILSRAA